MIFIANFKMMLTTPKAIALIKANLEGYKGLAQKHNIVICSSATSLTSLQELLAQTKVCLGAQNCSTALSGALTGEISAADLAACGVSYCLVGHSERRALFHETGEELIKKCIALNQTTIQPIFCIGETLNDYQEGKTLPALENQLYSVLELFKNFAYPQELLVAYEPVWAIGTGLVPKANELSKTFEQIENFIKSKNSNQQYKLLYGGSVSSKTVESIAQVKPLDGFLIGGASLDFQEFKKIVDYFH